MLWKWLAEDLAGIAWLAGDEDWRVALRGYLAMLFAFIAFWVAGVAVIYAGHWASEQLILALRL